MITPKHGDVPSPGETWLWIGFAGMVLGAVAVAVLGSRARREDQSHFVAAFFVQAIAACSYFAMASGQLDFSVGGEFTAQIPRYVDWALTTPLLLLSVSLVALSGVKTFAEHRERTTLLGGLIGADLLMIVTGVFASLNTSEAIRWTWFAISCGFFLGVFGVARAVLARSAERSGRDAPNHRLARTFLTGLVGLWLLYPIAWALGPQGADAWGEGTEAAVYAILDLTAKTAFNVGLALGVLRLAGMVAHQPGVETIDAVSEQLGTGADHRFHELGATPEAAAQVYAPAGRFARDREREGVLR